MEAITCTTKSTTFTVSKDEWNTKEDTGKSLKNALHVCGMPKCTSQTEVTSSSGKVTTSSGKVTTIALAVIGVMLV